MGFRYILLGAAIWAVAALLRHQLRNRPRGARPQPTTTTHMVECAHCGIHVPADHASLRGERYYCCPEHLDADLSTAQPGPADDE